MRILVCGGRDFNERERVRWALSYQQDQYGPFTCVINGGATGADELGAEWGRDYHIPVQTYRADWKAFGKFAGPLRNQRMIDEGKPDLIIAFPGGRGTADMVSKAKKAGIRVVKIAA